MTGITQSPAPSRLRRSLYRYLFALAFLLAALQDARAVDGTWVGATPDWADGGNWTSNPDVPNGIATFSNTGSATVDSISFVAVDAIQFTAAPNAQSFTINNNDDFFFLTGAGIINNSTSAQTFNVLGLTFGFINSSTASGGSGSVNLVVSTVLSFLASSTAGSASITNNATGNVNFSNSSTAGAATIANDGTVTFSDTASGGTANITNNATGTLLFSNASTAGGATIINNGSLQFTNDGRAGTTANITNNNALDFGNASSAENATITNTATMTFRDSAVAGTATIDNSAGTLTFSNSSSGQGSTIINNAGLLFADASRAGTANITNNATLDFSGSASADQAAIGNNAGIQFGDASSADHATITATTNSATIAFFGTSTAGNAIIQSATGVIGSAIAFADSSTAGSATIRNAPMGFMLFLNSSSAGNANIFNEGSGTLGPALTSFMNTSTAGSATITNTFGGVTFDDSSVAGTATIINNATGATLFGGAASADHATIVNEAGTGGLGSGGLTTFADASSAANATITTRNGGAVAFFDSSSGGAARFITEAGGVFDISQLTSPGITAGSIEGAGTYYLGDRQLTVGGNNLSTTVSGVISDGTCGCFGPAAGIGGSLDKVGTGTLTLAGINTYTGATTVNAGTLSVNGSTALSSLTTVNAGGTLGGTGIVGTTLINGGTLSPGNSAGTLTVQGNLALTAAASYLFEVTPTVSDGVNVTGTASLGGATVNAQFAAGSYVTRQYTIVNAAGGVIGTFGSQANTNLPSNFTSSLSYDANNAYLNLTLNFTPPPPGPNPPPGFGGLTQNQQNVGNALVGFFNRTGGIPIVFGALTPAGLSQVAGEAATGSQQTTFDAMNLFLNLLTDPFVAGRATGPAGPVAFAEPEAASAYAAKRKNVAEREAFGMITKAVPRAPTFEARWNVWAAGFGGSQRTDGNSALGAGATTSQVYGGAVGADYWFSPQTVAGFALAGGGTQFSVANAGTGKSDLFQAGAFVRHSDGPAYITGALAYGWQDITTDRNVIVAGLDRLRAQFNADAYSGRIEGGYRFAHPWLAITPYAAGQFTTFDLPSYAESVVSGASTFALAYAGTSVTATRSELGLRSDKSWALGDGVFTLRGRAAWAHDFNANRTVQATFQTLPGASFVVNGAPRARDAALTSGSAEWSFASGLALAATFEGEFSDVTRSYAGKGLVRYTW